MSNFQRIEQSPEAVQLAIDIFGKAMLKANAKGVSLLEMSSALLTLSKRAMQKLLTMSTPSSREQNRTLMIETLYGVITDLCTDEGASEYRRH